MGDSTRAADTVTPTGDDLIDGLLTNTKWQQDNDGDTTTITYSFPSGPDAYDGYLEGEEPSNGFLQLTEFQQNYFQGLLSNLSSFTNLEFVELSGARAGDATVRLGWTEDSDEGTVAWAYLPENSPWGGDVWLNAKSFSPTSTKISDYEVGVLMHEFGHALGLKHPHEAEGDFGVLPTEWDGPEYTSMTYNISADHKGAWESDLYPQTYMWLDIQALQHLYGKNTEATAGNETYEYDLTERHYLTIWDAGGKDTIKAVNGDKDVDINLTPGTWSDVGTVVTFSGGGTDETREATVFIAPDTIIEKAFGAAGNDKLTGNDVNNVLKGDAGADTLSGGEGDDILVGGTGDDSLSGGNGSDALWAGAGDTGDDYLSGGAGDDLLGGGAGGDTLDGGAGDDALFGGQSGDGINADDSLSGGDGNDSLFGGNGSDTFLGGAGDDILYGGKSAQGEAADDNLSGGDGSDLLFGGTGSDTLEGGDGDDTLFGGSGADTLSGGSGDDDIYGGTGDDVLTSGDGADQFGFRSGHGDDIVNDFDVSEDDLFLMNTATDFTNHADVEAAATETTIGGNAGLLIDTGGGDSIFFAGLELDDISAMDITF